MFSTFVDIELDSDILTGLVPGLSRWYYNRLVEGGSVMST